MVVLGSRDGWWVESWDGWVAGEKGKGEEREVGWVGDRWARPDAEGHRRTADNVQFDPNMAQI